MFFARVTKCVNISTETSEDFVLLAHLVLGKEAGRTGEVKMSTSLLTKREYGGHTITLTVPQTRLSSARL